ncbi:MAG: L-2-amino-thiazoline-4-carboxylic acid hydrolase [Alphaproteobacteria bacterium]|nr:L-2-amino-thiazoline-4-carboxylic acid hydrolase [Alphaproteobacteria bacterium]
MLGPEERAGLRVLVDALGWVGALRVGVALEWRRIRGEPFGDLPAAEGHAEVGSRAQAGPAVLLYRVLRERVGDERALAIVAKAVEEGAIAFLSRSIGRLDRAEIGALDDAGREHFAKDRAARFPNATLEWRALTADAVSFDVTACRLVELVVHAGHPELAPLFCAGDARFFGEVEEGAVLDRPTTIAGGDPVCRFTIRWRDA